jgi:hypothetical protein
MKICLRCDNTRWVCEAHPELPWGDSPRRCKCDAPGDPCPVCNRVAPGSLPAMPNGSRSETARKVALVFEVAEGEDLEDAVARFIQLAQRKH